MTANYPAQSDRTARDGVAGPVQESLDPKFNLTAAAHRINAELHRKKRSMELTSRAGSALEEAYINYFADLGIEAARLARKDGLEIVDRTHVERAESRLGAPSSASHVASALNGVGGVVAGLGGASAYSVIFNAAEASGAEVLTAIALCAVGFVMLAVAITLMVMQKSR